MSSKNDGRKNFRMKSDSLFFSIYLLVLSLFFYHMIDYWNTFMEIKEHVDLQSMGLSACVLAIYSIFILLISKINFLERASKNHIFLVCILWCIMMPVIMWINRSILYYYALTLLWPLLFMSSYVFIFYHNQYFNVLRLLLLAFFIYSLFLFFQVRFVAEKQINNIYFPIFITPWLLCFVQKRLRLALLLLFFSILAMLAMKRSILLAFVLAWFFYIIEIFRERGNKWVAVLSIVAILGIAIWSFSNINEYMGNAVVERIEGIEEDEGSNRVAIYQLTLAMIASSSPYELLTGHGHYGVYRDSLLNVSSHNDFLECIYDYGIIIFLLYLYLWYYVIKTCLLLYRRRSSYFFPYALSFSLFMSQSLFEHLLLYTSWFNYLILFWGGVQAMVEKELEVSDDEIMEL